jgi:hypothetical protein
MKDKLQPLAYLTLAFVLGSTGYLLLSVVLPWPVFAGLFRMFMYHDQHPFQYIALISVAYCVIATTWAWTIGWKQTGVLRWLSITAIVPVTIIVAVLPATGVVVDDAHQFLTSV